MYAIFAEPRLNKNCASTFRGVEGMGCCTSCFRYTEEYYYIDEREDYAEQEMMRKAHERAALIRFYEEQHAREKEEGIYVIPMETRVAHLNIEHIRAVFPPTPVRPSAPPSETEYPIHPY